MKKTLCKTIHKKDCDLFIAIEDIVSVRNFNVQCIQVYLRGDEIPFSFQFDTTQELFDFRKELIKELEEYYNTPCYKYDLEHMELPQKSSITYKLNTMSKDGWELVDMLTEGVKELLVVHRKIKED